MHEGIKKNRVGVLSELLKCASGPNLHGCVQSAPTRQRPLLTCEAGSSKHD